jgi:RNA polymerase sigma factor (sigma-70 family)
MTATTPTSDVNPFTPDEAEDRQDQALVEAARGGDRAALEALVRRHQRFLFNLALRMVYAPQEAEDATQEILVKAVTKLASFEGRSRFRTWLYRIAVHHLLNLRRLPREERLTFRSFAEGLDRAEEGDLPDPRQVPVDVRLLVEEAKVGCTMAMLMCLDREQRLVYALGEILGATDAVAAEVLDVSRDAFRQKLSRARRELHGFMNEKCGLVNPARPCRCEKKTRAYMKAGYVDPAHLVWARERVERVREVAARSTPALPGYDGLCADLHRENPFQAPADLAGRLREVIETPAFRDTFHV